MFQDRLPSAAIKCMQGCAFAVTETNDVLEQACKCCTAASGAKLHLGPDLARMLIQRSHDHVQSVEAFRQSVKYAFISHYYGNPLSIFGMDTKMEDLQERDFEAMRNLHSFRQYLEQLLDRKQAGKARRLLDSNEALAEDLWDATITANTDLEWLCGALTVIQQIQQHTLEKVLGRSTSPYSSLYIKALSGSLNCSSPSVRELLLSIKKLDSEAAESIISHIADTLISMPPSSHDISPDSYFDLQDELSDLVQQHGSLKPPSFLNPGTNPASATIASSKPSTSKSRTPTKPPAPATTIPPHLKAYTSLLTRLHDLLKSYFTCTLPTVPFNHPDFFAPSAPSSTPTPHAPTASSFPESRAQPQWNPHEILFLSTPHRSLLKPALIPSPRHAIERALSRPHDYLGCSCCAAESSSINRSPNTNTDQRHGHDSSEKNDHQPATAILYQLYLESGTLINVADLWTAFRARLTPGIGAARLINGMRDPETERGGYGDAHGSIENEREDVGAVGGDSTQPTSIQTHPQQPEEENTEEGSEEEKERMTRALFVRGLAELKYLGMIRSTRRRNDCVLKVLWRGL